MTIHSGDLPAPRTKYADARVSSARKPKHSHAVGMTGTTRSGSWIASESVESRKVVLPVRGAARSRITYSTAKIAIAIGAFQLRMIVISGWRSAVETATEVTSPPPRGL